MDWVLQIPRIIFLLLCGCCFGIYIFFKGLYIYRKYVFLTDIPKANIRGVPMGLVHLRGKATADEARPSPAAKTPCLFYRVEIFRPSPFNWAYEAGQMIIGLLTSSNSAPDTLWKHFRTVVDCRMFYLGDDTGKIMIDAREAEIKQEVPAGDDRIFGKIQDNPYERGSSVVEVVTARVDAIRHSSLSESEKTAAMHEAFSWSGLSGSFLTKEWCIQPGREYTVIGSCIEMPSGPEGVKKMIKKGANDRTFTINSMDERQREKKLHSDALTSIWGGGTLAVVSLGALLYFLHYLSTHWNAIISN